MCDSHYDQKTQTRFILSQAVGKHHSQWNSPLHFLQRTRRPSNLEGTLDSFSQWGQVT